MPVDDIALFLQRGLDRLIRRARIGRSPEASHRRVVIVQIDGLSAEVLDRALLTGRMPFLRRLLADGDIDAGLWRWACRPPRLPSRWRRCTGCGRTFQASTITTSGAGWTFTSPGPVTPRSWRRITPRTARASSPAEACTDACSPGGPTTRCSASRG